MVTRMRHTVINRRRACAARVTVVGMCVCVCLSVYDYSRTTGCEAAYERYQQLHNSSGYMYKSKDLSQIKYTAYIILY